jgi:pantothenate kinase
MDASALAGIVDRRLEYILRLKANQGRPFVFHLLGPPSVGKTFLQEALFSRWNVTAPCFFHATSFVLPRSVRLERAVGECSVDAYDIEGIRSAVSSLLMGQSVRVPQYDHQHGRFHSDLLLLSPADFYYIEGPAWLRIKGSCFSEAPSFQMFMRPRSFLAWKAAYIFRNIKFRNYNAHDARRAFDLAEASWLKALKESEIRADLEVIVDFSGASHYPVFEVAK